MAGIGAIVGLIGSAVSAVGAIQQGKAAQQQAEYEAELQKKRGREEFASKQREALTKEHEAKIAESRARALAAASGAGGSETPTVLNTLTEIFSQGDYNQRALVAQGQMMKDSRYDQAALIKAQGDAAYKGSILQGIAGGIGGLSKLYG